MNPEMFDRLRRFGDTVDQAAVSAGAPAGPLRDVSGGSPRPIVNPVDDADDLDDLEPVVVPITGRRRRRYRTIVAAAAALIIVVAGAVVLTRLTRSPNEGRAVASTDAPGLVVDPSQAASSGAKETASTSSTTSPSAVAITSTPATSESTTSTSTTVTSTTTHPTTPPVCPTYTFNSQYPIKLCNRGAAVELIQSRLGLPVDGFFGPATQRAVRDFQSANGLEVDGLVGQNTWAALGVTAAGTDLDDDGVIDPEEIA